MSLLEQWAAVGLFLLHFHQHHHHQFDELAGHPTTRDNEIKPFEKYIIFVYPWSKSWRWSTISTSFFGPVAYYLTVNGTANTIHKFVIEFG